MKASVLLLGLGRIASSLEKDPLRYHPCTHAGTVFSKEFRSKFTIEGYFDPNPEKRIEFESDWKKVLKNSKATSNKSDFLSKKFDLCVIASSSESHFKNAMEAMDLSIPHILIEKPLCKSLKELSILKERANRSGTKIWVNHERRYHPIYKLVKDKLDSEEWGEIKSIRASVLTAGRFPGLAFKKSGGGPLLHDGTHAVDYLDYLFGEAPKILSAIKKIPQNQLVESQMSGLLVYQNSIPVFLEAGGERNYFAFEIDIHTSSHRIVLSNDGHRLYRSKSSDLYSGFYSLKEIPFPNPKNSNPWIEIYREIYENISGKHNRISGGLDANERILKTLLNIQKKSRKSI